MGSFLPNSFVCTSVLDYFLGYISGVQKKAFFPTFSVFSPNYMDCAEMCPVAPFFCPVRNGHSFHYLYTNVYPKLVLNIVSCPKNKLEMVNGPGLWFNIE